MTRMRDGKVVAPRCTRAVAETWAPREPKDHKRDEQEEIFIVDKIHWEKHSWKHLSLIGDETVINLQRAKVYVFSDSVLCLGR